MPDQVVRIDRMAAKPCRGARDELAGAALWRVPKPSPGILGVTWTARGRVARAGGALPWRDPLWDPGPEATLPPLLSPPPGGQQPIGKTARF